MEASRLTVSSRRRIFREGGSFVRRLLATAARGDNLNLLFDPKFSPALTIQRFNLSTIHEATARVLLRDISKILFPDSPSTWPLLNSRTVARRSG
jgi:hypothetical protein